jgi:cyclohexyl-isocyanide hydratase
MQTTEGDFLVGFVLFPGFTALDLIGPHEVLVRCCKRCLLITATLEPVLSHHGVRVLPDVTFGNCPQLDVLVVPGGPGQEQAIEDEELIDFIRGQSVKAIWTASVCTGALLLARAGALNGRRATTHWLAMDELARLGAIPVRQRVVWENRTVTAAGVSAGIDMALGLVAALYGPDAGMRIQLAIEYDPEPPFAAGAPDKAPQEIVESLRRTSRFANKE